MKLRFINRYVDESDPGILILEADVFKSKHQPKPDERVKLRVPIENAYVKKEIKAKAKTEKTEEEIQVPQIPIEIDFEDLGVYNVNVIYIVLNYLYRYMGFYL